MKSVNYMVYDTPDPNPLKKVSYLISFLSYGQKLVSANQTCSDMLKHVQISQLLNQASWGPKIKYI